MKRQVLLIFENDDRIETSYDDVDYWIERRLEKSGSELQAAWYVEPFDVDGAKSRVQEKVNRQRKKYEKEERRREFEKLKKEFGGKP